MYAPELSLWVLGLARAVWLASLISASPLEIKEYFDNLNRYINNGLVLRLH